METDISRVRDDELLGLICRRAEDKESAENAWLELYRRHVRFVFGQVKRAGSLVGRGLDEEDIVFRTFEEVYLTAADSFQPGTYPEADSARHHVLAWLGAVAKRTYLKEIASRGNEFWATKEEPRSSDDAKAESCSDENPVLSVIKNILTPEEVEIVWLKMPHYNVESGESRLLTKDLEALCFRQGISKSAVRKRYERALTKVEEALVEAHLVSRP